LRELRIEKSTFSGSGFPALPKLEQLKIYEGQADGRLFKALLGCPELKYVFVDGFQVSPQDAQYCCFSAKIDEIYGLFRPRLPEQERDALATFQMETQGDFACECPSGP
jgi:hypothetical protein